MADFDSFSCWFFLLRGKWVINVAAVTSALNLFKVVLITEDKIVLCYWDFDLAQDIIDYGTVPKELLLVEIVDEEGLVLLDVSPCHQVWKPV